MDGGGGNGSGDDGSTGAAKHLARRSSIEGGDSDMSGGGGKARSLSTSSSDGKGIEGHGQQRVQPTESVGQPDAPPPPSPPQHSLIIRTSPPPRHHRVVIITSPSPLSADSLLTIPESFLGIRVSNVPKIRCYKVPAYNLARALPAKALRAGNVVREAGVSHRESGSMRGLEESQQPQAIGVSMR
ncbi:hypothetical protein Tco_0692161 [Tanacetum coccineum]